MKHVFSDISHIAHLFANQLQDSARNSGNFYFEGSTIYSYGRHFEIAKHVTNEKGEKGLLFTENSYSVTTSQHKSVVHSACRHLNIIYCPDPSYYPQRNFEVWQHEIENEIAPKLLKAKKPELYLSKIEAIREKANRYATFFCMEVSDTLKAAFSITNKEQYADYQANKQAIQLAARKKSEKELQKRHKKELTKWLNLETNRIYNHNGFDYLRLNNGRIETTQAVELPLQLGIRIYDKVKADVLKVGDKVLDYTVNQVGKVVKIGCHTFKREYLLKFGQQLVS